MYVCNVCMYSCRYKCRLYIDGFCLLSRAESRKNTRKCLQKPAVTCQMVLQNDYVNYLGDWSLPKKNISPKSIPNSQKQKQLPNTRWVKYVYCPALLTLEAGVQGAITAQTLYEKPFFHKCLQYCRQYSRSLCEGFFQKNCRPPHSSLHLPNIHHPHLLCPLHHLHLLYHLLHHLL